MKHATPNKKVLKSSRNFSKKQLGSLKRDQVKPLRVFEKIEVNAAGRHDGKQSLPVKEGNVWHSPYLDEELKKYQEYCYRLWGRLQLTTEPHRTRIDLLKKTLPETRRALSEAREALAGQEHKMHLTARIRRKGEDSLTDEQVQRRRENELASQLMPFQSAVRDLEHQLETDTAELAHLESLLKELEQSTTVICRRVEEHTKLRVAAYWSAAMKHQAGERTMPMTPTLEISREAEQMYRRGELLPVNCAAPVTCTGTMPCYEEVF